MPSPYNALVRAFLRKLEGGRFEEGDFAPLLTDASVLHAPAADGADAEHVGVAGFSAYFAGLRGAADGSLTFRPQSFELRERGAVSLVHATGVRDGEEFLEHLRVIFGLGEGRIQELWLDPGDRASFAKHLS